MTTAGRRYGCQPVEIVFAEQLEQSFKTGSLMVVGHAGLPFALVMYLKKKISIAPRFFKPAFKNQVATLDLMTTANLQKKVYAATIHTSHV